MGSRNTSVRTGRQKVSQITDNTRPPGLSTLVPVRLFRDFAGKTAASFRTNPTAAAVIRTRNHNGTNQFANLSWHQAFGLEEYGHGNYVTPAYDAGSGEFTTGQYTNAGALGGSFASADARLVNDVTIATDTGMLVLDTKQSRDGRYTYVLSAARNGTVAAVYFNVVDNLTGAQVLPTYASVANPTGIFLPARTLHEPLVTAWGSIAVVDDTTSQDATHHMAYNSCMFTVQFVTDAGGGNFSASHAVFRFDYVANNVDEMYSGGTVTDFTTTNSVVSAWAEIQLCVQTPGTLQVILAYRGDVTITSTDRGSPRFAMWTTFVAGDNPTSGPTAISGATDSDFNSTPTTAVSRRGAPTAARRFYYYNTLFNSQGLRWRVLNPATFFSAGVADQDVGSAFPAGSVNVAAKASPLPPSFVDGSSNPHMFVVFLYRNTTANVTDIRCFMHTTVTTATDTTPSLGSNPPGITIATATGSGQPTQSVGVTVAADGGAFLATASVVYLHPTSHTYTLTEVGFTDPTDQTKIFPQAVITTAGSTNTLLNTLPGTNRGGFAFGSSNWDFASAQDKHDIESLAFVNAANTQVILRVTAPYAAIALLWDADVYENLPNPTDVNTNGRVTTFYARATGANYVAYSPGARLYSWSTGGFTTTIGSNAVDLTGGFASATAPTLNVSQAHLETTPAFTHPATTESTTFVATMVDEFTFNISSWGGGAVLSGQVQAGMTIGIQDPFSGVTNVVRYTIADVTYDATNQTITQIRIAQPSPFHATSTTYSITISAGPSTAIRQLVTTVGDGEVNNRTGNVVFPMVVQLDYVNIETIATSSEIAEVVMPLDSGFGGTVPTGAQITLRGYNLTNTTIPNDLVNGLVVGVSLDAGSTWNTKPLRVFTTLIHGQTLATSFGVQSFSGASDLSVPWVTVPAGIAVGDYLLIGAGPNAGRYVITGLTNDSSVNGPRIYVDRPFPVPGSATIETWYSTSAKDDYENDGTIPNLGFGSFGMNFDLTGMTASGGDMHVRVEFKDGVTGHDVTYEIDSISVQWSP